MWLNNKQFIICNHEYQLCVIQSIAQRCLLSIELKLAFISTGVSVFLL